MYRLGELFGRHLPGCNEDDGGDQSDPGPIDFQTGNAPEGHSDVGQRKNDGGKRCHRPRARLRLLAQTLKRRELSRGSPDHPVLRPRAADETWPSFRAWLITLCVGPR